LPIVVTQVEEPERPVAVTVIGRVWLVLAGIVVLKDLLNMVTLSVLRATAPVLLQTFGEHFANMPLAQFVVQHAVAVLVAQVSFWTFVGVSAWNLLHLRSWARVAMQAVGCVGLVYVTGFLLFWLALWHSAVVTSDASLTEAKRSFAIAAGVVVWLLLSSLFGVMLGFLRSSRVRQAFL
jgi:hypothetical protein